MHTFVKVIADVATRYAPSRILSFSEVHVFKTLQLIKENRRVSRAMLRSELALGEGAVRTLIKHMKMDGLISTTNGGTKMTLKGKEICCQLASSIPSETRLPRCSVALGKFNHAVLLKNLSYAIKSGIEQRDAAIKMNGIGATTLLYIDRKLVMPTNIHRDSLRDEEPVIRKHLVEKLKPKQGDVIIIGSSDNNPKTAELASKNAALYTLVTHEKHTR